jgi:hypothetical protein
MIIEIMTLMDTLVMLTWFQDVRRDSENLQQSLKQCFPNRSSPIMIIRRGPNNLTSEQFIRRSLFHIDHNDIVNEKTLRITAI